MQATIQAILVDRLKALQSTNLVLPNGNYAVTSGVLHLRAYHLPGRRETVTIGSTRMERQPGVWQVSVFAPLGKGDSAATAKVDALTAHFPAGWAEVRDGVTVQLDDSEVHSGQVDPDGWWVVPVDIGYVARRAVSG
jgi:hypothetical protein